MARRIALTRSRGMRAGLDLETIVRTARLVAPGDLTMQSVAKALGVDRKALNYHVEDREGLLALVAKDAFSTNFATVRIPEDCSWQEACRIFAEGFAASLIETGLLVEHFRLGHSLAVGFLKAGETMLSKMISAGFDGETAARLIHMLGNICIGYAKDCVIASRGNRDLARNVRTAISYSGEDEFENTAALLAAGVPVDSKKQLELSLAVFLEGAQMRLRPPP